MEEEQIMSLATATRLTIFINYVKSGCVAISCQPLFYLITTLAGCTVGFLTLLENHNVLAVLTSAAPLSQDQILIELDKENLDDDSSMISSLNEEIGNFFEGDMVLTWTQLQAIQYGNIQRNGLKDFTNRWPSSTVLYQIVKTDFDDKEVSVIKDAMSDISNKSCLQFRPSEMDEHAVIIQGSANGCFSSIGYIASNFDDSKEESDQVLNLSKGCLTHGTVVHEILHTLGFYHMQSTYDRDEYIEIVWENIRAGKDHNFAKSSLDTLSDFGVRYDYGSVMHYSERAFSKNGNRTIIPLQEGVNIGQRIGLSESDILKLNRMYCEGSETGRRSYINP